MGNIQIDLLYFINNGMQNTFLDKIVPILYAMADVRVIYALTVLIFLVSWKLKKDKIKKIAFLCIVAYCFSSVLVMKSKIFYPSIRPFIALEGIRLAVHDNGFYSFPSGHVCISTTAISIILLTVNKYKRELFALGIIYLLILSFVCMYGGVHYPIDIIGGIIIGVISAVIIVHFKDFLFNLLHKLKL